MVELHVFVCVCVCFSLSANFLFSFDSLIWNTNGLVSILEFCNFNSLIFIDFYSFLSSLFNVLVHKHGLHASLYNAYEQTKKERKFSIQTCASYVSAWFGNCIFGSIID